MRSLYVGVMRIGLMKIMRDAIMRMQKQRRHIYAVYCCIGAWAASGDQVFYGTSVREQSGLMQAMQVIECIRARRGDRLMSSVLMESTPRHVRFYMPWTICIRYVLR